ncbi:TetR/AcrR family transcriptional regulator [Tersicoccus sp. MR15.9]|uniref:TetR/AcrR family transcriptional regulator n=1 Tax=Tersicoccus mangrovi TaxID=3121635 RepID=UPI002FE5E49E
MKDSVNTVAPTGRVPRRRTETRRRLLEATEQILLDGGISAVTVDSVTGRAGYTRGAFYSNFTSVDELIFGIYSDRQTRLLDRLTSVAADTTAMHGGSIRSAVETVIAAIPFDIEWLRIRIGFASQARFDPCLRDLFEEHEHRFLDALSVVVMETLRQVGLTPTVDAKEFTRAVVAAHNGALANSETDEDPSRLRVLVCTAVVLSLTRPLEG